MSTETKTVTAEQLLEMGDIGPCELIRGEIIHMSPASSDHGRVAAHLLVEIGSHVKARKSGELFAAETGFVLARNPDTVRAPDVAFVSTARAASSEAKGYFEGPPDLAVEVMSPWDRASEVAEKVEEWLKAGSVSVWVVDPRTRTVQIHRKDGQTLRLHEHDKLQDEPALSGFSINVRDIFQRPSR